MKNIILVFFVLLAYSCKTKAQKLKSVEEISSNEIKEIVSFLAHDSLQGRDTGTEGIERAALYIENYFKTHQVKPYYEDFRDSFEANGHDAFNVVGFIEGNDSNLKKEVIAIGAHYDHIGIVKEFKGDSIANGANDNAAGTSAVLALAKQFSAKRTNKRSLLFVLFSAEEKGLLGSKHLAKKLKKEGLDLYTMVNFEMIGVPFKDRDYNAFVSGYEMSNMATKINEYIGTKLIGFSKISKKYNLFRQSDNAAFYDVFKTPCHTISSCDLSNYDFYHHADDETDKLDYEHMASLINKIMPAIEMMSKTPIKEIKMYE